MNWVVPSVRNGDEWVEEATRDEIRKAYKGEDGYSIDLSRLDEFVADLAQRLAAAGESHPWLVSAASVLLLISFGIKAAVFPLHFWLPDSYEAPRPAVSALFAGLLTKVGVYAMVRVFTVVLPPSGYLFNVLLVVAGLTMLFGVLGAVVLFLAVRAGIALELIPGLPASASTVGSLDPYKLSFISILAGFSERLVPNLLDREADEDSESSQSDNSGA